jgi:fatty acid desaturase
MTKNGLDIQTISIKRSDFQTDRVLLFGTGAVLLLSGQPWLFGQLCLLWLLPLYTFTQLLQKIRRFAEHTGEVKENTSGSWKPSLFGKLTIWPYNINYHREHHYKPGIPWDKLPDYYPEIEQRSGSELWQHIYDGKTI